MTRVQLQLLAILTMSCSDGATDSGDDTSTSDDTTATDDTTTTSDCADQSTHAAEVACAANAFLATLSASQVGVAQYDWSDSEAKTLWSNLPPRMKPRAGITFGELSDASRTAAYAVAKAALSDAGYEDYVGVIAADEYLTQNGGGSDYGADNYAIAFVGEPTADGSWTLMLGGHHMAFNITYQNGVESPTPNHLAAEPKVSFTLDGESYAPVASEGAAFVALMAGLNSAQRSAAYLDGQVFDDVLLGPDEYGTGSYDAVNFPSGSDRGGVLVSTLDATQQALVTAVLQEWVGDFDASIADELLATYTSEAAFADTYVAWAGNEANGPDLDVSGSYFRIDGPRVWVEVAVQGGIVIRGETHPHTIFRDKANDYGASL